MLLLSLLGPVLVENCGTSVRITEETYATVLNDKRRAFIVRARLGCSRHDVNFKSVAQRS